MVVISRLRMGLLLSSGMQTSKFQASLVYISATIPACVAYDLFSVFQLWVSEELQHAMHSRVSFLGTKVWE